MQKRKRVNAKQTAKGAWQLDVTVEIVDETGTTVPDGVVSGEVLSLVKQVEADFVASGRKLVGDGGAE
jgi:hypothetical protein